MNFLKKLFGLKTTKNSSEDVSEKEYALKSAGLEKILGSLHPMVGHAIIPFEIGGAVDMYYFPNAIKGTGFATMELINVDGTGPIPNRMGTYELVGFTKLGLNESSDKGDSFELIERRFCRIFTYVALFSSEAKLKPGDTCELPEDNGPNKCLIFDEYKPDGKQFYIGEKKHGLLLIVELFPQEMQYARQHGSKKLFERLKESGHYPYSDLDREPVV